MYTLLLINFFNKDEMSWQEILTQNGYRITQPRVRIMELLQDAALALTPQQIHAQLLAQGCDMGLVSVYRTLDLLAQLELVAIVYDPERNPGYVISSVGHHHHIVCQQCHQALEFSVLTILTSSFSVEAKAFLVRIIYLALRRAPVANQIKGRNEKVF